MKSKKDSSAWTIEVANQLRLNSPRYKKTMELIKAYRFDKYFELDSHQEYDYQAKSEDEFNHFGDASSFDLLKVMINLNHNIPHDYVMWKHYRDYMDEFAQDVHEFDSLKTPTVQVDGATVDYDVAREIEDALLEEVTPNIIREFSLTLFASYTQRFKTDVESEYYVSGYNLADNMKEYGLPEVLELAGWESPREKEQHLIEQRKAEAEAKIAADKAEAMRVLVAAQKKSISDRKLPKFNKRIYAIYSAFAKAREQWTSKTNRQNQLLKFELTIAKEVAKLNKEILHDVHKFATSDSDTDLASILEVWETTMQALEYKQSHIQVLAENVVKDHEFVSFDEFVRKIA